MTFTKISILLLLVAAVALGAYGFQILRPAMEEKTILGVVSPTPEINYLVGAYEKAKDVQQLQDNRFTSGVLSISEITSPLTTKGEYTISGSVLSMNTCPPCPKGSEGLCSPCPPDSITVSDDTKSTLRVEVKEIASFKTGHAYTFIITKNTYPRSIAGQEDITDSRYILVSAQPK